MCISYLTSSDVLTYVIITSENSVGIIFCEHVMCFTSKKSGGISIVILAFSMTHKKSGEFVGHYIILCNPLRVKKLHLEILLCV